MKTLQITITEEDFERYEIMDESLTFTDLIEKMNLELAKQALERCRVIAEETGLSQTPLDNINADIKILRNAASHS